MKKKRITLSLMLLVFLFLFYQGTGKMPSVNALGGKVKVSDDLNQGSIGGSFQSCISYTENYVLAYYYIDPSSTGKLYVKTSINYGNTWSSAVLVDEDSNLGMGGLDVASVGNTTFCGYGDDTGRKYYFIKGTVASNGTITFGSPVLIYDSAGFAAGSIDVGYSYYENKYYYASGMDTASGAYRYRVYTSSDGASWTKIGEIDGADSQSERYWTPFLCPNHFNNDIYTIYGEYFYGYGHWLEFDGASWGGQTNITPQSGYYMSTGGGSGVKDNYASFAMSEEVSGYHYVAMVFYGEKYIGPNYVYGTHLEIFNSVSHTRTDYETIDENDPDSGTQYPTVGWDYVNDVFYIGFIDNATIFIRPYFYGNGTLGANTSPFGTSFSSPTNLQLAKNVTGGYAASWKETGVDLYFGASPGIEPEGPPPPPPDPGPWWMTHIPFFMGVSGFFFMIVGPIVAIVNAKNGDWEKGWGWVVLLFMLGIGLVIGWLWS